MMLCRATYVVLFTLLAGSAAQPCTPSSNTPDRSERLEVEHVNTPDELLWAVGNGTELIVIQQDLDLRTAPNTMKTLNCGVLSVTGTVAIQVCLARACVRLVVVLASLSCRACYCARNLTVYMRTIEVFSDTQCYSRSENQCKALERG